MKQTFKLLLSLVITVSGSQAATPAKPAAASGYGQIPLHFEPNRGQATNAAKYVAHGGGYSLSFEDTKAVVRLMKPTPTRDKKAATKPETTAFEVRLAGANANASVSGDAVLPGKVNYLIGNDATKWKRDIPTFARVKYASVYDGVDLVYYGNQGQLEYDFMVAPGADASVIELEFAGIEKVTVDEKTGGLALHLRGGCDVIQWRKPVSYQVSDGARVEVASDYVMLGDNKVGFRLGAFDNSKQLVIDPTLVYSTYLGGTGGDSVNAIAVDAAGCAYVTGTTMSSDFPIVVGAFQDEHKGFDVPYYFWGQFTADPNQTRDVPNAFVSKLSADGRTLLYSTFIGGTGGPAHYQGYSGESSNGIAVDGFGCAYITGSTFSGDYPVTAGAYMTQGNQLVPGNTTAWWLCAFGFVTKFTPDGSGLVYSTLFGARSVNGTAGNDIALNANNEAFVSGFTQSDTFPVTPGVLFPSYASTASPGSGGTGFALRLNAGGTGMVYATLLPGSANGSVIDAAGNMYITGSTWSPTYPVTANAYQATLINPGNPSIGDVHPDAFVMVLNSTATGLVYSTLFGGLNGNGVEFIDDIALDGAGHPIIGGSAFYSADMPTTPGAYRASSPGDHYFVAKFDPLAATGPSSLVYCTCIAPAMDHYGPSRLAADGDGNVFFAGTAFKNVAPVTADALQSVPGGPPGAIYFGEELFLVKLNDTGSAVLYGTYFGGSGFDNPKALTRASNGDIYLGGITMSADFPLYPADVFQTQFKGTVGLTPNAGPTNGFVVKLAFPNSTHTEQPGINGGVPTSPPLFGTPDPLNPGKRTGTISGTGHPGCTIEVTLSDPSHPDSTANNSTYTTTVDADGNWSLTLTLDDCHPTVSIVQICDGVRSDPVEWQILIDNTPPVFVSAPGDGTSHIDPVGTGTITLVGTATDPDAHVPGDLTYIWERIGPGGERTTLGTDPTLTLTLPPGDYTIEITVTDPAGNKLVKRCVQHIEKRPTTIECPELTMTWGGSINISAPLIDELTGEVITGKTLTYTINSQPVTNPFSPNLFPGVYDMTAAFTGDDVYAASTSTAGCHIEITANPGKITGGGSIDERVRNFGFIVQPKTQNGVMSYTGNIEFQDKSKGIDLKSDSITMITVSQDRKHGAFRGTAKLGKTGGYTFTCTIDDLAEPGAQIDTFRIQITGPNGFSYDSKPLATKSGVLDKGGNIQIHKP